MVGQLRSGRQSVSVKLSQLARVVGEDLENTKQCVCSDYIIFLKIFEAYRDKKASYLRGDYPTKEVLSSVKNALKRASILARDTDYKRYWRILPVTDGAAEEVACLIDPFCYVSHLSAMQRYGLTVRRPEFLYLTQPAKPAFVERVAEMRAGELASMHRIRDVYENIELPEIKMVRHPDKVRDRKVHVKITAYPGQHRRIRGTSVRVGAIGQVFCDMIEDPELCGGMAHVIETWKSFANVYVNEIIETVSISSKPIVKVRAGYLLDEIVDVLDPRIDQWLVFAQRGGSRVLDPAAKHTGQFSEKWMIATSVGS